MGRRTQIISVSPPLNVFILEKPELESLRDEIDQIDEQVVNLLNKRVRAAAEIGKIKHEMGVDPYDPSREEQVFEKIEGLNEGSIPHDSLRAIYREVISSSIALEKDLTIGYLGPEATFTHQAAMLNFGSALSYRSLPDIPDVFQAVEKGECDYGVVPIENSTEGAVNRSLGFIGRHGTHNHCPSLFKDRTLPVQPELARQNCRSPFQGSSACSMWRMAAS